MVRRALTLSLVVLLAFPVEVAADDAPPPPLRGFYIQAEGHGSFFSDVGDRSVIQNTFGYGFQAGHRWGTWRLFIRAEHNLWLASEFSRDLNLGALNLGVGVEHLYFDERVRAMLAIGPSVLLFNTEIDQAGSTGFFVDVRPAGLRWPLADGLIVQWDPLTLTIVAPVLTGIPLVMLEYRTAIAIEFDLVGLAQ